MGDRVDRFAWCSSVGSGIRDFRLIEGMDEVRILHHRYHHCDFLLLEHQNTWQQIERLKNVHTVLHANDTTLRAQYEYSEERIRISAHE